MYGILAHLSDSAQPLPPHDAVADLVEESLGALVDGAGADLCRWRGQLCVWCSELLENSN